MKTKDTLLREIAGLASLVSTFPEAYQNDFVDNVARMLEQEMFDFSEVSLIKAKPEFKAAVKAVRANELGGRSASASIKISFMQIFAPLAETSPEKLDKLIELSCAEIVHRRIWDELEKKYPLEETFAPVLRQLDL